MDPRHNAKLTQRAQKLRREATPQERHLWYDFLSHYPIRFRRQVTIDRFIVDFYCAEARLVVEIDGSQHYSRNGMTYDKERTLILNRYGLEVIRFSNQDINFEFTGVCEEIHNTIKKRLGCDPYDQL